MQRMHGIIPYMFDCAWADPAVHLPSTKELHGFGHLLTCPGWIFLTFSKRYFSFQSHFVGNFKRRLAAGKKNSNQFFFFSVVYVYYYSWLIKMGFRVMEISRKEGRESRTRSFKIAEISLKSCRHNQSDQMARSFFQCLAIYNNEYLFAQ